MKDKKILISVHDISPIYKKELKIIFNFLNNLKINKKEAFVVLNWLGKYPLEKDKELIKKIKDNFSPEQINFHGFNHYSHEQSFRDKILFGESYSYKGEFKEKTKSEIEKSFKISLILFKKIFNRKPLAFIPCRWENSDELLGNSRKIGIKYTEDASHLIDIGRNKKKFSFAICFDYGDNRFLNKVSKLYSELVVFLSWAFNLPIRFSIHPNDVRNGNIDFEMNLLKKLINKGWHMQTTKEFWGVDKD